MNNNKPSDPIVVQDGSLPEVLLEDEKVDVKHEEDARAKGLTAHSRFEGLSRRAALRVYWLSTFWACAAGIGALFDGFVIVIPGSIIANKGFVAVFGSTLNSKGQLVLDPQHVGAWGGLQSAGQIVAMWGGPFLSDRFGRKPAMYLLTVLLTVAVILEIFATDWRVYLIARFLAGAGTGMVQSGITVYISEISAPQIRGSMLAMYSVMYGLGGTVASIALKIVGDMDPSMFRRAFYSQFAFLGLFIPFLPFLPESPWFYARRHEHDKAKNAMKRLYGNIEGWDVDTEYHVLSENVRHFEEEQTKNSGAKYTEMFRGVNARRTFVSFFPLAFQQFCGLSLVLGYSSYFFSLAGLADPFLASMIVKIILTVFKVVAMWTVEYFGRRSSLLVGGSICGLVMLIAGILKSAGADGNGSVIIAIFCIYAASFASSVGPIGYTFVAETSTPRLRAKTAGFAAGGAASFGLLFNYTTPLMLADPGANWGLHIGYFWAGLCAHSLVIVWFAVPEIKGRSHSEIDELFERRITPRKFHKTLTSAAEARQAEQMTV